MKYYSALLILFCLHTFNGYGQDHDYQGIPSLIWPKLYNISFEKGTDNFGEYDIPVFSKEVINLEKKEITLPGYIVPFEGTTESKTFLFSALPLNACFFCGVGGPESVIEIHMESPIRYVENAVEMKGILKLNKDNPDQHFYILENASLLGKVNN
ncbi:hypothetical protein QQ008_28065 [Fulvivirgaceae bacterium BMA10]|uniref:DUF3299 domain-containing protein n=1 Tax=Splendidivirga corallicola TaxID=3051826 RepID=A0ABT8KWY9_9BACT|nr:hypothetical protein [Fulvivirgaceae bacterium BMA10]